MADIVSDMAGIVSFMREIFFYRSEKGTLSLITIY